MVGVGNIVPAVEIVGAVVVMAAVKPLGVADTADGIVGVLTSGVVDTAQAVGIAVFVDAVGAVADVEVSALFETADVQAVRSSHGCQ